MKVKDTLHGTWKNVELELNISVRGSKSKDVDLVLKMIEDFVSTTLSTEHRLLMVQKGNKVQTQPYPEATGNLTYTRIS